MQNRNVIGKTSHAKKPRENVVSVGEQGKIVSGETSHAEKARELKKSNEEEEKSTAEKKRKDPISYKDILRTYLHKNDTSEK